MDRISGQITPLYFFNPVNGELNPLHLTVKLDGEIKYDQPVILAEQFCYEFSEDDQTHTLEFTLSGRTDQHTLYNDRGEVDRNSCVSIRNFCFNDVPVNNLLYKVGVYSHSVEEPFNGSLAFNGTACVRFTTPIDLWLFEHM